MKTMYLKSFLLLTVALALVSSVGQSESIHEYLHAFHRSIDERVEIFHLEMTIEERAIILRGEVSEEKTLKQLLQGIATTFKERTVDVDVHLLHRGFGLINTTEIELMKSPSSKEVVTQLLYCDPIKLLKEEGDWVLAQGPDSYIGWVQKKDMAMFSSQEELQAFKTMDKAIVAAENTLLYEKPHGEKTVEVLHGTRLPVASKEGEWLQIPLPHGDQWIREEDTKPERVGEIENIIETILLYLETPYLWGGTNIRGADCSGLIQRVLDIHSIKYPRDSDQQHLFSSPSTEERKRGDLLFFSTYQANASHVGLYLGDGSFIHSSSAAGGVVIHSLHQSASNYNAYLKERLLGHKSITMNTEELAPWLREDEKP